MSINRRTDKEDVVHIIIYTMEYYSAIKRNAFILPIAEMRINLETIIQSEVRKRKISYNIYMWNLGKWYR